VGLVRRSDDASALDKNINHGFKAESQTLYGLIRPGALTMSRSLSLYLMMTCLNSYFVDPEGARLSEALVLAPNGGAIAVWSSTGLTIPQRSGARRPGGGQADPVRSDHEVGRCDGQREAGNP
jgi:Peptidase family C25